MSCSISQRVQDSQGTRLVIIVIDIDCINLETLDMPGAFPRITQIHFNDCTGQNVNTRKRRLNLKLVVPKGLTSLPSESLNTLKVSAGGQSIATEKK